MGDPDLHDLAVALARVEERVIADRDALVLARRDIDRRLNGMNELREQINRERGDYVNVSMYTQRHEELMRRLDILERWQANITGRAIGLGLFGGVFIALIAALVTHAVGS